jgi:glycosyltransferase involved in cell wall biosynthesis
MKKILLIHNIMWSHYKAAVFTELNKILAHYETELLVVHISQKGIAQKNLGDIEIDMHRYPHKVIFKEDYEIPGSLKKSTALIREIFSYQPDIVILPGYNEISFWIALLATKLLKIPSILTFDSTAMDQPKFWYKEAVKRLFVRGCNAAFSYGTKSKEYLMALGMPSSAIFIRCQATKNSEICAIHKTAYAERQKRLDAANLKPHNFIYVGRLSLIKNIGLLIRCFENLKSHFLAASDWGLIIVGDGPQCQELNSLCAKIGASDVYFAGGKSWREVPEFYALADVFVLPSTSEAWGLVVNEAMSCGLPVVVSNCCGSAYDLVIEGENGFVFDPFNEAELTDQMQYFIENPDSIERMGDYSKQIISNFTPENSAKQMYLGIQSILEKTKE